ncbi:hypothetical protein JG687_00010651 [Phytophthora cactorum]|uniref:Uncharacterized protein n=1 Tax=Phytophthora cactorum TaxID=29920 RepID=A0A8T1U7W5_9STRA|nr:hypothetical protein JG687_00010651 [Phytophthora cactorum]
MVATDAAFLAEVAVFLDQNDAPEAAEKMYHKEVTTPGDDGLLLASHQLLAETEKLLSSYDTPTDTQHELNVNSESTNTNPSEEDKTETLQNDNISTEKRREIRNAQAAQRRLRYRQKLRDEKETLRQQTTELSTQLTILETAQVELKTRQASNLMFGAWRAVAARQLERRLQAEQQQKLLRAEVVGRARLIHQMSLLLEDRLKSKQQDRLISYEWVETNCETGGSALFTTMLEELDDAYLRTDDFVYGLEFESAVQVAYNLTRNQKDGVLYFDSADRVVVPYNFEQAAVGLSIVMMSDPDVDYATVKVEDLKDTLTIKYHVKFDRQQPSSVSKVAVGGVYTWDANISGKAVASFDESRTNEDLSAETAAKAKRELGSEAYASTRERSLQILRGGAQATAELPTRATVRDTNEENEPHVDGVVHSVYGATDELDV